MAVPYATAFRALALYLTLLVLLICLLTDAMLQAEVGQFQNFLRLISASRNLWVLVATLSLGMVMMHLTVLRRVTYESVFFVIVLCHYVMNYDRSTPFTNSITLMMALALTSTVHALTHGARLAEIAILTVAIPVLVTLCLLWGIKVSVSHYAYYDLKRLTGIWNNPNNVGVLMAMALTMSLGLIPAFRIFSKSAVYRRILYIAAALCVGILFYGLVFSLSRGAWVGAVVACLYLAFSFLRLHSHSIPRWMEVFALIAVSGASMLLVAVWITRSVELPMARRLGSISNPYDLSAGNRVAAYRDALRLVSMEPLTGHGWKTSLEKMKMHSPDNPESSIAISTNSYLSLAISMGLPSLLLLILLFARCILWFGQENKKVSAFTVACRGGVVAGVVGFWFNGGMLATPLWAVFWIILALGSIQTNQEPPQAAVT